MSNKINEVSTAFFTQRAKDVNRKEVYHFDEEKGHSITYFPIFSKSKKDKLIIELIETIQYCKDNNIDYLKDDADMEQYLGYLIIKHFTSLYDTLSKWSVEDNIAYLKGLYDSGDFELFFDEIFTSEEVTKVFDQLRKTNEIANVYKKELDKQKQLIESNVKNNKLKEKALNQLPN
ncbi:hypothetical protein MHB40_15070 [Lysinibacillus sp. FSL K6-0057]|uniref:hypothetical protein n=1 Tax=Lysinibacillus sp. FSL K6-0057 TaxID=2921411 RepID=UPI003159DBEE